MYGDRQSLIRSYAGLLDGVVVGSRGRFPAAWAAHVRQGLEAVQYDGLVQQAFGQGDAAVGHRRQPVPRIAQLPYAVWHIVVNVQVGEAVQNVVDRSFLISRPALQAAQQHPYPVAGDGREVRVRTGSWECESVPQHPGEPGRQ